MKRCLSLGCGEGALERRLASLDAFQSCDAIDIADGSIDKARKLAQQAGYDHIRYSVQNVNQLVLPEKSYDAVWVSGAMHHFEALEHVCIQVTRAFASEGRLILNEYIGPNRFQFPERQRQVIQACNDLLPAEYRRMVAARLPTGSRQVKTIDYPSLTQLFIAKLKDGDLLPALRRRTQRFLARQSRTQAVRGKVNLPTVSSVAAIDPSEAVRSADIMPTLREYFEIMEYRPLGGTILQFLLADIAGNFETEEGRRLLQMLFAIEDTLMQTGDLSSDFAYIVAQPKVGQASTLSVEPRGYSDDHGTP